MDRRRFLKTVGLAGIGAAAATSMPWKFDTRTFKLMMARAYPFAQSPTSIRKFVTTLPGLGPTQANNIGQYIPLATKTRKMVAGQLSDVYNLAVAQFAEKMHPDLKRATHFYGYYDLASGDQKYLAGVIVAKKGTPVLFNVTNQLPNKQLIPIDPTIMAGPNGQTVGDLPLNRIITHLHGGLTPWFSDGTPFQWYTPYGMTGPSFSNVPGIAPPHPGAANHYYPMDQSARFVWYHDHAIGITRTNAYAGIASALIITDDFEASLIAQGLLPDIPGFHLGIPLVIQDKSFVPANILVQDPKWIWGKESDLWYPHIYEGETARNFVPDFSTFPPLAPNNGTARWSYGPTVSPSNPVAMISPPIPLPKPASLVPEAFFDTALVNGAPYPVLKVTDRTFRFRFLNGSQARFWHLNLYQESATTPGEPNLSAPGPDMYQIGTEGGFLPGVVPDGKGGYTKGIATLTNGNPLPMISPYPASTADPTGTISPFNLLMAPAERADILIDFTGMAGKSFILYNDAVAPFPAGDARNEYFTGDLDMTPYGGAPTTRAGFGPNTRTVMKIRVSSGSPGPLPNLNSLATALQKNFKSGNQPALLYNGGNPYTPGPIPIPPPPTLFAGAAVRRQLTLNEDFDDYGRLIQTLGTTTQNGNNNQGLPTRGQGYMAAPTENPRAGSIEIWDIYNLTGDTHPIHFHLVNVQILQRASFDASVPAFAPISGTERGPDANELGWKDTVRMNPAEVTTIIAQFNLPTLPTSAMRNAVSPRTGGREYVWHCHILEHEEHDMMRPLVVS